MLPIFRKKCQPGPQITNIKPKYLYKNKFLLNLLKLLLNFSLVLPFFYPHIPSPIKRAVIRKFFFLQKNIQITFT